MPACLNCQTLFEITDSDRAFFRKIGNASNPPVTIPDPVFCPKCRMQQKQAQINHTNLFQRKCDGNGQNIISVYPSDSSYKVYSQEYWFSDKFDGTEFGRDFDFNRPFFEQFAELSLAVPRTALFTDYLNDENSAYTNNAGKNKNCYLIFDSDENRDCLYCYGMNGSVDAVDCYRVEKLELCYENVDSTNCYGSFFAYNSDNCTDCILVKNCIGCSNCIMCSNLQHKDYYFKNKPVSKEEYQVIRNSLGSYTKLCELIREFQEFQLAFPQKFMRGVKNEDCTGNYLNNCKNAIECYDSMKIWDGKYCEQTFIKAKDCMDIHECGLCELMYESSVCGYNAYNFKFSMQCLFEVSNLTYCNLCYLNSSDLFGCIGLKRKKLCILNKQYSEAEYLSLIPRIVEHTQKAGEWGQFFPIQISTFPYNLSLAQDFFPLSKEEALAKGYKWCDPDQREYLPQNYDLPDNIKDVPDSITDKILACTECGKNYKIVAQEFKFYKKAGLPLPRKCFHCRHKARMALRNPRHLWDRTCQQCGQEIKTSFAPERPEIVYCEDCYQKGLM